MDASVVGGGQRGAHVLAAGVMVVAGKREETAAIGKEEL